MARDYDRFSRYMETEARAFAAFDNLDQNATRRELELLWSVQNLARGGFTVVEAEWLEVIAAAGENNPRPLYHSQTNSRISVIPEIPCAL